MQPKYGPEEGLARIKHWCDLQERCPSEVRQKLRAWHFDAQTAEEWLNILIDRGFVDEQRFAEAFVSGKFRLKQWGRRKIQSELRFRDIPADIIARALGTISTADYHATLQNIIARKRRDRPGDDRGSIGAVARYAISRGYEPDLVWDILNK